jgi:anti-sigma-K factor RskA
MIDESKQDLLVQYLLNEVDSSTAEKIRTEIETDAELRDFVRETEDALAALALVAPALEPPADLWQRILQTERNVLPFSSTTRQRPPGGPNIVWLVLPWALAACFAIACTVLQLTVTRLQKDNQQASQELLATTQKNAQIEEQLALLEKKNVFAEIQIATLKAQVANYGTASAVVVWDKQQKNGVLQVEKLPPAAKGKDYQLWVIDPKIPQPVSAGILAVPNDGLIRTSFHTATPIDSAAAFAISVEKTGGAPKPEGQIILVGK